MPITDKQLNAVLEDIDRANRQDPNLTGDGTPSEYLYAQRMTEQLVSFVPDAEPALQIAARAQHIERWVIPRSDYPMDRSGYKRWRTELGRHHAERARQIMLAHGCDENSGQQVADMLQKKRLKLDPQVQALEDVICLVFIRHYLEEFAAKHEEPKLIDIIRKTWKKMSPKGHEAALAGAGDLPEHLQALIGKALAD